METDQPEKKGEKEEEKKEEEAKKDEEKKEEETAEVKKEGVSCYLFVQQKYLKPHAPHKSESG